MTYNIITAANVDDLIRSVNQAIASGWQCIGGVQVVSNVSYYQAMVLPDDKPAEKPVYQTQQNQKQGKRNR